MTRVSYLLMFPIWGGTFPQLVQSGCRLLKALHFAIASAMSMRFRLVLISIE